MPKKSSISVVPIGKKVCKPFVLEIMVFSPESGYKFKVIVERSCSPEADAIWKLVFDLFKVQDGKPDVPLVHISYTAGTPVEQKAIQTMVTAGVTKPQAAILVDEVFEEAKNLKPGEAPAPEKKKALKSAMSQVVNVDFE